MIDLLKVNKALSNQTRIDILEWLKSPEANFPPHTEVIGFDEGVCLVFIKNKAQLSQSTISQYTSQLLDADLVIATRIGKWTYFKRNEQTIQEYAHFIKTQL